MARFADPNGVSDAGETYVVFGTSGGFDANLELANLNGDNGFTVNGVNAGDMSGASVSGVGDINGDGYDDLLIGAREADPNGNEQAGEVYAIYGQDTFSPAISHEVPFAGTDEFSFI